jgi:hypothetical protein
MENGDDIPGSEVRKCGVHSVAHHGEGCRWMAPVIHSEAVAKAPFVNRFAHAEKFLYPWRGCQFLNLSMEIGEVTSGPSL